MIVSTLAFKKFRTGVYVSVSVKKGDIASKFLALLWEVCQPREVSYVEGAILCVMECGSMTGCSLIF